MLSNLLVKANILSKDYQRDLAKLSAFELHSVFGRCPLLGISFDPSNYRGVTERQIAQWQERHWWGRKTVSMTEDNREEWAKALARELLPKWRQLMRDLDEESALELLWLARKAKSIAGSVAKHAEAAEKKLILFLKRIGDYSEHDIEERLRMITGD